MFFPVVIIDSTIISILSLLLTFLTLLVITWYTLDTRKMRIASEANIKLLGAQANRSKLIEDKSKQQKKNYIFSQLKCLTDAIKTQVKNIEAFIEQLQKDEVTAYHYHAVAGLNTKNIRIINSIDIYEVFVDLEQEKTDYLYDFNLLLQELDFIDAFNEQITNSITKFFQSIKKYESIWNENLTKVGELNDSWYNDYSKGLFDSLYKGDDKKFLFFPPTVDHLRKFFSAFTEWQNKDNLELYFTFKHFVNPFLTEIRSSPPNDIANKLLPYFRACESAVENLCNIRKETIKQFQEYKVQLNKTMHHLSSVLKNSG